MCGIIGILGKDDVAERLVDGLRRLEYRGYDSAGVCTINDGRLDRRRADGILNNLSAKIVRAQLAGTTRSRPPRRANHAAPSGDNDNSQHLSPTPLANNATHK